MIMNALITAGLVVLFVISTVLLLLSGMAFEAENDLISLAMAVAGYIGLIAFMALLTV